MPEPKADYFTKSEMKQRGWSDSLLDRLLGDPDKLATN
jgi:hypothetical protein